MRKRYLVLLILALLVGMSLNYAIEPRTYITSRVVEVSDITFSQRSNNTIISIEYTAELWNGYWRPTWLLHGGCGAILEPTSSDYNLQYQEICNDAPGLIRINPGINIFERNDSFRIEGYNSTISPDFQLDLDFFRQGIASIGASVEITDNSYTVTYEDTPAHYGTISIRGALQVLMIIGLLITTAMFFRTQEMNLMYIVAPLVLFLLLFLLLFIDFTR